MKVSGVIYIDLDIIIEIHRIQIEEHGGAIGARSLDGLKSAIAQPQASFGNEDLHVTIFDKAAAYAYFIAEAQAFVDGNKRVALATALTFLAVNGYEFTEDHSDFYNAMIAIAKHELDKEGLSSLFRETWISATVPKN